MARGGSRLGAGRKVGATNLITRELRNRINAPRLITFLQDLAEGRIDGATISERKDAAVALLRKVMPDVSQQKIDLDMQEFQPIKISRLYQDLDDDGVPLKS
jgi:hypothetical protein